MQQEMYLLLVELEGLVQTEETVVLLALVLSEWRVLPVVPVVPVVLLMPEGLMVAIVRLV
jgi:hypothetical protein